MQHLNVHTSGCSGTCSWERLVLLPEELLLTPLVPGARRGASERPPGLQPTQRGILAHRRPREVTPRCLSSRAASDPAVSEPWIWWHWMDRRGDSQQREVLAQCPSHSPQLSTCGTGERRNSREASESSDLGPGINVCEQLAATRTFSLLSEAAQKLLYRCHGGGQEQHKSWGWGQRSSTGLRHWPQLCWTPRRAGGRAPHGHEVAVGWPGTQGNPPQLPEEGSMARNCCCHHMCSPPLCAISFRNSLTSTSTT